MKLIQTLASGAYRPLGTTRIRCSIARFPSLQANLPRQTSFEVAGRPFSSGARQLLTHAKPSEPRKSRTWRNLSILAAVATSVYVIDEYYYALLIQRSCRAVYVLSWVAYNYAHYQEYPSLEQLNEDAAEKIFDMLRDNKGLYIKQGQAIANQGAVFPTAFQKRFVALYDAAPEDDWAEVDRMLRVSLGPNYERDVFEYIDHKPVASALIAQVHRARLKEEKVDVAVKVQHPYIAKQIHVDLAVYKGMSWVYLKVFDLPLSFFTAYVADQIVKEADFRIEASNAERLASLMANDSAVNRLNIHVPRNYPEYSSKLVLVTEWIDGVSLTNKQRLVDAGLSLSRVMTQYIQIFGRQIFTYGFVHSDPHPGNLIARFDANGKQQLVILDHGLYVTLSDQFRRDYRDLWKYMFDFDSRGISTVAESWGIGSSELLQTVVLLRPPSKTAVENAPSSSELIKMFLSDEKKFPLELLFILRTMRMMQNLNQALGSPVNRINLLTKTAVQLGRHLGSLLDWVRLLRIRIALLVSDVIFLCFRIRQIWRGDRYGDKGEGIEDYIERYMRQNARAMGIEIVDGM